MSASLVGSEMCIRDRPAAPQLGDHRDEPPSDLRLPHCSGKPASAIPAPVSYTHLSCRRYA
eukprot:13597652-Alexandrium_andersonii.AAC.1